uniref:Ras-GEF domain-containing protein n=1 Tax=Macrostomum lignano TaxID=282301 RepID=A0A1I8IWT0_9PLAT
QTPESLPLLQLFNYLEGDREQYLYMRLFCSALPQELARLYRPAEVLSPTPGLGKLLSGMSKAGQACPVNSASSSSLAPVCETPVSPPRCTRFWLAEKETESGVPAGLPYQVTAEQALEQPEVRSRLDANVRALRQTAGQFVRALTQCACPILFVARRYRRRQPAAADAGATRATLGSVAKMLQLAAANKGFGAESCSHLHCLNRSLREWQSVFEGSAAHASARETADPGAEFDMDEYSEMARLTVPTLHISVDDLQILDELERVADGARPLLSAASSSSSSQSGRVTLHLSPRHDPLDLDYLSEQTGPATLGPAYQAPISRHSA